MKRSKIIKMGDREVTLKELTVQEIADCMDAVAAGAADETDLLMIGRLPSEAVIRCAGLERAELRGRTPSELAPLWEAAGEVNPFFVTMMAEPPAVPGKASGTPSRTPARS